MGRESGITEEQLRDLSVYERSSAYTPLERLVIEYAVEMTKTPVEVPDALFTILRQHFDEAQLDELSAAVAWENYRARFNHAFDIGSQALLSCPLWCGMEEDLRLFSWIKCSRCSSRDTVKIGYGASPPRMSLRAAAGSFPLGGP